KPVSSDVQSTPLLAWAGFGVKPGMTRFIVFSGQIDSERSVSGQVGNLEPHTQPSPRIAPRIASRVGNGLTAGQANLQLLLQLLNRPQQSSCPPATNRIVWIRVQSRHFPRRKCPAAYPSGCPQW